MLLGAIRPDGKMVGSRLSGQIQRRNTAPPQLRTLGGIRMEKARKRREGGNLGSLLILVGASVLFASAVMAQSSGAPPVPPADTDEHRIAELVEANHILANEHVVDGFGHISVRSVKNPKHFYLSRSRAPALVTVADIMEFDENSQPVDQKGRTLYGERFIHGEIFRARPDVIAVVHSHSPDVVPFSVTKAPFQALVHVAGFLGATPVPVFEIRDVLGAQNDMLVHDNRTGAGLAKALGDRTVVLMRGHGMAVTGPSVPMVVLRSIYTQLNAHIETEALKLGMPTFLNAAEASRVDPTDRPWEIWAANADRPNAQ
jgi:HCOMODA/2-hydroxy-3-carboxy-muconic semialdehyde decarboxylase